MGGADVCNWSAPDPWPATMLRICGRCARYLVRGRSKLPKHPHLFRVHSTTATLNAQVSTLHPALDRREPLWLDYVLADYATYTCTCTCMLYTCVLICITCTLAVCICLYNYVAEMYSMCCLSLLKQIGGFVHVVLAIVGGVCR